MIRFFANANYDFMGVRRWAYIATAAVALAGIIPLAMRGLNQSIEFTGGTLVQLTAQDPAISDGTIRAALDRAGIVGAEVQAFGAPNEFVIRARLSPSGTGQAETTQQTAAAVDSALGRALG
jgi:preprotein translocase subunit SecF